MLEVLFVECCRHARYAIRIWLCQDLYFRRVKRKKQFDQRYERCRPNSRSWGSGSDRIDVSRPSFHL